MDVTRKILAEKVIETARNQVYFALRYLEPALFRLQPLEKEDATTGSDGKYYYYNADYLCRRFLQNPVDVEYDYLHTVLHCLFRHPMRIKSSVENRQPESMRSELSCENRPPESMRKESTDVNQQHNYVRNESMNGCIYWNLAADIAVTEVIAEMALPQFQHVIPQQCLEIMEQIRSEVPFMDIPQIARYLEEHETQLLQKYGSGLQEIAESFARDIHSFWGSGSRRADFNQKAAGDSGIRMQSVPFEEYAGKSEDTDIKSVEYEEKEQENPVEIWTQKEGDWQNPAESWIEIAETIAQNIEDIGDNTGSSIQNAAVIAQNTICVGAHCSNKPPSVMLRMLRRMTRDSYDYTEFLRKFARPEECMKLDEDSFDYVYYVYGLNCVGRQDEANSHDIGNYHDVRSNIHVPYNHNRWNDSDDGNDFDDWSNSGTVLNTLNRIKPCPYRQIALLEPLEYREEYRIRTFVIAIDTSASCSGRLVQQFLNKTYHILKSTESFSERVVVHILQCDCAVREDIRIENFRQFEEYLSQMRIRGMGGTDFRPVFDYVNQLCAEQKLRNPGGLIYFTDGRGTYPKKPPAYRTAFVFVGREDEMSIPSVPPWAMKLYLEEDV